MKSILPGLLLVAVSALQGDFEALFRRGLELAQSGRDIEAIESFRTAHRLAPGDASVLYNLGSLLARVGQTEEAIERFHEAAEIASGEPAIRLALGELLYHAGRTSEAIPHLAAVSGDADALVLLGKAYEADGDFPRSIEALARYLELRPDDVEARLLLGEQLAAQKRYDEAIEVWRAGLSGGKRASEIHYKIGEVLSRAPSTARDAESSLRRALALEPAHFEASLLLARLLSRERRTEEALEVALAASVRHPGSPDVSFLLASLYQQLGELDRAEAARAAFRMESAEKERREHEEARIHVTYKRARELLDSGRALEAKREFASVLELDPENALVHSMLAKIAFSQGELGEARRYIEEALARDPDESEFHYLRGLFASRGGDAAAGEESTRRALELEPGLTEAWLLLGVLLADSGRVDEGLDCFRKAETLEPSNATVYLNLAAALEKKGEREAAEAALARYRELSSRN
jgi:tetratricopeptide (TPR) repeat protein